MAFELGIFHFGELARFLAATHREAIDMSHPYFESGWMANHHQRGQGVPMPLAAYERIEVAVDDVVPVARLLASSRTESPAPGT
jgi:hypothetical protein